MITWTIDSLIIHGIEILPVAASVCCSDGLEVTGSDVSHGDVGDCKPRLMG